MRATLTSILGGKAKLKFVIYSHHTLVGHPYEKLEGGPSFYPCKSENHAIEIVGDLLEKNKLEHSISGIYIKNGDRTVAKISIDTIRKTLKEKADKRP